MYLVILRRLVIQDKLRILDLGFGENKIPGVTGLGNIELSGVDIVHDLMIFPPAFQLVKIKSIFNNL